MADTVDDFELEVLRARIANVSMLFGSHRRKRAAGRLAALGTPAAARVLAEAFVKDADWRVTEIARQALTESLDQAGIDAVCDVLIATGDERLTALLARAGHLPSDPGRRAVLLFLAGEFERYAELDFDGSLLRAAHEAAGAGLRRRLAVQARTAGRVEWVRSVAGGARQRRLAELSDDEWETVVKVLVATARWEELWALAVQAPVVWGARMLRALGERGWQPAGDTEPGYDELVALAVRCSEDPAEHTPGQATVLQGHSDMVTSLAVTPDGELLASSSWDRTVRLWRLPSGAPAGTLKGHRQKVTCLAMSPDGGLLASGGEFAPTVRLWRLPTGAHAGTLALGWGGARCLAMTPDGDLLASADGSGVRLWRLPSGVPAGTVTGHTDPIRCLAVTPDGALLASADLGGRIRLWRLPSGVLAHTLRGHKDSLRSLRAVTALAVTPDGGLLASAGWDRTVRLWQLPSGAPAGILEGHGHWVTSLAVTPDGGLLASNGGHDGTVRLWRLPSGTPAGTLCADTSHVNCLAITPDGRLLATDGGLNAQLWRLPSGKSAGTATIGMTGPHWSWLRCLAVTPDGGLLVGGFHDGAVRLWPMWSGLLHKPVGQVTPADLERLRSLAELPAAERGWAELISALVRHRRRHDVEIAEAAPVVEAGEWDIEIAG